MADEQPKKRRKMGTMQDIKTATTSRIHSKPAGAGQEYIDLWTLKRDRARWDRVKDQAEQRLESIDKMIGKIHLPEHDVPQQCISIDEPDARRPAVTIDFQGHTKAKRTSRREEPS